MIQYGTNPAGQFHDFPTSFTSIPKMVATQYIGGTSYAVIYGSDVSETRFKIQCRINTKEYQDDCSWIAVGY